MHSIFTLCVVTISSHGGNTSNGKRERERKEKCIYIIYKWKNTL